MAPGPRRSLAATDHIHHLSLTRGHYGGCPSTLFRTCRVHATHWSSPPWQARTRSSVCVCACVCVCVCRRVRCDEFWNVWTVDSSCFGSVFLNLLKSSLPSLSHLEILFRQSTKRHRCGFHTPGSITGNYRLSHQVCLEDKNETYAVQMLFYKGLDCSSSGHWQLYSMFYGPYCCLSGHLLWWFVETKYSPGPTVEHKIQFVLQHTAPTCNILRSAGLYLTFMNVSSVPTARWAVLHALSFFFVFCFFIISSIAGRNSQTKTGRWMLCIFHRSTVKIFHQNKTYNFLFNLQRN